MAIKEYHNKEEKLTIIYLKDGGIISVKIQNYSSKNKTSYILNIYDSLLTFKENKPLEIKVLNLKLLNSFIKEKQIKLFF
jgi:hypothetical protein